MSDLHPETLTWTALLAKWMQFAQASLSLPDDAEGDSWRNSVTAVIHLQAVTFALADLNVLSVADRPLACDRAELLINENTQRLQEVWHNQELPESLQEIIRDARLALKTVQVQGFTAADSSPEE